MGLFVPPLSSFRALLSVFAHPTAQVTLAFLLYSCALCALQLYCYYVRYRRPSSPPAARTTHTTRDKQEVNEHQESIHVGAPSSIHVSATSREMLAPDTHSSTFVNSGGTHSLSRCDGNTRTEIDDAVALALTKTQQPPADRSASHSEEEREKPTEGELPVSAESLMSEFENVSAEPVIPGVSVADGRL
jgi:hypothetical protein